MVTSTPGSGSGFLRQIDTIDIPASILVREGYGQYREFPYPYFGAPVIPPKDVGIFDLLFEVERNVWYSHCDLVLGYYPLFNMVYTYSLRRRVQPRCPTAAT